MCLRRCPEVFVEVLARVRWESSAGHSPLCPNHIDTVTKEDPQIGLYTSPSKVKHKDQPGYSQPHSPTSSRVTQTGILRFSSDFVLTQMKGVLDGFFLLNCSIKRFRGDGILYPKYTLAVSKNNFVVHIVFTVNLTMTESKHDWLNATNTINLSLTVKLDCKKKKKYRKKHQKRKSFSNQCILTFNF